MHSTSPLHDYVVLAGIPTLSSFLAAAQENHREDSTLAREWHIAHEHYLRLQSSESSAADAICVSALPDSMLPLTEQWSLDATARSSAEATRSIWVMVELDRLVVHQRSINLTYVRGLQSKLPTHPTNRELFDIAAGALVETAPIHATKLADHAFSFLSDSLDMRLVDAAVLDAHSVKGYEPQGRAAKVLTLFVGHSINQISAFRFRDRLLLTDGHHRAVALRALGITHAPCLVTHIDDAAELMSVSLKIRKEDLALFSSAARPPLLKDFLEGPLHRAVKIANRRKLINVQFSAQEIRTSEV